MARTLLFRTMEAALSGAVSLERHACITRRNMLQLSAGTLAMGLAPRVTKARTSPQNEIKVAIVGGGAAGLTAAYRLQLAGLPSTVFEASNRWGGRMLTRKDFYDGMFCELGGELVDTRHEALRQIVEELGLSLQPLYSNQDRDRDLYFFGGKLRSMTDMLDPVTGTGAFIPIARQIASDKAQLRDAHEEYTPFARKLDATSLGDYLDRFRGQAEDWAIDLIAVAYIGEFGSPLSEQSSLNLVDLITAKEKEPFQIFGESDEAFRIENGSSSLIDALVRSCQDTCKLSLGSSVTKLVLQSDGIEITVTAPEGVKTEVFDRVILALPFTRLRLVDGIDRLGLSAEKMTAIRELGYGTNAKLSCGTLTRTWRNGDNGLGFPSNGAFYSDLPFQNVWETSRAQPGDRGILTNFLGGDTKPATEAAGITTLRDGLAAISPQLAAALDTTAVTSFFWERHPFTLGSYACAKTGQYTALLPVAKEPECDGRLHFAGEHTEPEFLGYMNGAIVSGNRTAAKILSEARFDAAVSPE